MASIIEKIRVFVKAKAHKLLDAAIDMDSPEVLKQYIREYEEALSEMDSARATAKADVNIAVREVAALQKQIAGTTRDIETLLGDNDPNNDHFAVDLENRLMGFEGDLKVQQETLAALQQASASLEDVGARMRTKHREMTKALTRLSGMDRAAKAQEGAAAALKAAGSVASGVDATTSVDNLQKRIERRLEVAQETLKQQSGAVFGADGAAEAVAQSEAARRIAERRAKIAAAKNGTAAAAATSPTAPSSSTETI